MCMSILTSYPAFSLTVYLSIFLFPTLYSFSSTAYSKDSPRRLFLRNSEFRPAKFQCAPTLSFSPRLRPLSSRSRCAYAYAYFELSLFIHSPFDFSFHQLFLIFLLTAASSWKTDWYQSDLASSEGECCVRTSATYYVKGLRPGDELEWRDHACFDEHSAYQANIMGRGSLSIITSPLYTNEWSFIWLCFIMVETFDSNHH